MKYRTKRRYQVEFYFDKPAPGNQNKKVMAEKVKTYSMAAAIKEVETKMWQKGLIRHNKQPRYAMVLRLSWPIRKRVVRQ